MAERIASSWPKEPFDVIKKIDSQNFQSWVECSLKYLVWSFGLVRSFDLVQIFDLVRSVDLVRSFFLPMHASVAQVSKRHAFWSLNEDILKITILKTNTPYPSRKIRRIRACTHQRPQRIKAQYAVSREAQYAVFKK
ncbi:hypothetical protein Tco_1244812 [Tanacetum coccineum]